MQDFDESLTYDNISKLIRDLGAVDFPHIRFL